jgi:hypothetical protein
MPTTPAQAASPRPTVGLPVVISELQFFNALFNKNKNDDRLTGLAKELIHDFLDSMKAIGFSGGDENDPVQNPVSTRA